VTGACAAERGADGGNSSGRPKQKFNSPEVERAFLAPLPESTPNPLEGNASLAFKWAFKIRGAPAEGGMQPPPTSLRKENPALHFPGRGFVMCQLLLPVAVQM